MTITAEQRARRTQGIGSSDAPIIAGVSPWKTPLALWLEKIDGVTELGETLPMRFGNALEDVIANEWARENGIPITAVSPDTIYDREDRFLFAHVDRFVGDDEGLECKYVSSYSDEWGIPGTDQVPAHVAFQCLHAMMVTGAPRWHVGVCNAFYEFRSYIVPRVDDLIAKLRTRELEFWQLVEQQIPPPMMSTTDVRLMYPRDSGSDIIASPPIVNTVSHLAFLKRERDSLDEQIETVTADIQGFMGEHARLIDPEGKVLATWRTAKDSRRIDIDRLRAEAPEVVARFSYTAPGARKFLLK